MTQPTVPRLPVVVYTPRQTFSIGGNGDGNRMHCFQSFGDCSNCARGKRFDKDVSEFGRQSFAEWEREGKMVTNRKRKRQTCERKIKNIPNFPIEISATPQAKQSL